jgi:predicted nucleotidyltransferase
MMNTVVLMSEYGAASLLLGRSRIRQRILALLIDDPERRRHLRAIARSVGTSAGTAARELGRLENAGLVTRTREGGQVYFRAQTESPLYGPIREIVRQTIGAPDVIRRSLAGLGGVERAVIFGSYAQGDMRADSDVDLLIVGAPDRDELTDRLEAAGREIGRPVNEIVMTSSELAARRARGDRLVESIEDGPSIQVLP